MHVDLFEQIFEIESIEDDNDEDDDEKEEEVPEHYTHIATSTAWSTWSIGSFLFCYLNFKNSHLTPINFELPLVPFYQNFNKKQIEEKRVKYNCMVFPVYFQHKSQ